MPAPSKILLVRFQSRLTLEEVVTVVESRIEDFRALSGLQQKYYLQDPATGEYAGLYLWDSVEALVAFNESELRRTIAQAYEVEGQPRVEVYDVVEALRE